MIYKAGVTAVEFGFDASNSAGSPPLSIIFMLHDSSKLNHFIASIIQFLQRHVNYHPPVHDYRNLLSMVI